MSQIYEGCVANFAWLGLGNEANYRAMHTINTTGTRFLRVLMAAYVNRAAELCDEELRSDPDFLRVIKLGKALSLKNDSDTLDPFTFNTASEFFSRDTMASMFDLMDELLISDLPTLERLRDELFQRSHPDFEAEASAWQSIMGLPLWTRIWIVQELVLPPLVILQCGGTSARLDCLVAICLFAREAMATPLEPPDQRAIGDRIPELYNCFASAENSLLFIADTRRNKFSPRNAHRSWNTIHVMLQQCGSLDSTNPLDKVFGLMSIAAADLEHLKGLVGYNKTFKQLMMEVMRLTLSFHGMRHIQEGQWFQYPDFEGVTPKDCLGSGVSPFVPSWVNIMEQIYPSGHATPQYRIHEGRQEIAFQQFDASKSYIYQLSPINFPRPDVLRAPCRRIGNVKQVYDLPTRTWDPDQEDYVAAQLVMAQSIINETESFFEQEYGKDLDHALHGKPLWWLFGLQPDAPDRPAAIPFWESNMEQYRRQFFALKEGKPEPSNCTAHRAAIIRWMKLYSPFTIDSGYLGLGPRQMRAGDVVVIFPNVDVPYILRQVTGGGYKILGQAYVLGIMNGEFLRDSPPEITVDLV